MVFHALADPQHHRFWTGPKMADSLESGKKGPISSPYLLLSQVSCWASLEGEVRNGAPIGVTLDASVGGDSPLLHQKSKPQKRLFGCNRAPRKLRQMSKFTVVRGCQVGESKCRAKGFFLIFSKKDDSGKLR